MKSIFNDKITCGGYDVNSVQKNLKYKIKSVEKKANQTMPTSDIAQIEEQCLKELMANEDVRKTPSMVEMLLEFEVKSKLNSVAREQKDILFSQWKLQALLLLQDKFQKHINKGKAHQSFNVNYYLEPEANIKQYCGLSFNPRNGNYMLDIGVEILGDFLWPCQRKKTAQNAPSSSNKNAYRKYKIHGVSSDTIDAFSNEKREFLLENVDKITKLANDTEFNNKPLKVNEIIKVPVGVLELITQNIEATIASLSFMSWSEIVSHSATVSASKNMPQG